MDPFHIFGVLINGRRRLLSKKKNAQKHSDEFAKEEKNVENKILIMLDRRDKDVKCAITHSAIVLKTLKQQRLLP